MKKKTLCLLLVLVLTMGLTATFSFADSIGNGDASTYATAVTSFATKRISDTKASASVLVQFTRTADEYVVAIVLQKKTSSGWVTATDVSGSAHYYSCLLYTSVVGNRDVHIVKNCFVLLAFHIEQIVNIDILSALQKVKPYLQVSHLF